MSSDESESYRMGGAGACGGDVLGVGPFGRFSQRLLVDAVRESVEGVETVDGVK